MEAVPLKPRKPLLDVAYYEGADAHHHKHKLDIYHPPGYSPGTLRPVVLHVHGGGWVRGDRKHEFYGAPYMGRSFSERGYVTVVCSYRLAEHGKHPAQVRDVARALLWVVSNIKVHGGDVERLFLSGHSAGAHVISLLALHPRFLAEVGLNRSIIKGVVAISGIYNLLYPMHERARGPTYAESVPWLANFAISSISDLSHIRDAIKYQLSSVYVKPNFGYDTAELHDASPIVHLRAAVADNDVPPFLVINAASDLGLEIGGSWFAKEMQRHKAEATYQVIAGTNHASVTRSELTVELAHTFIQQTLQRRLVSHAELKTHTAASEKSHLLQSA